MGMQLNLLFIVLHFPSQNQAVRRCFFQRPLMQARPFGIFSIIGLMLIFSSCSKDVEILSYPHPVDRVDTSSGRITFEINGKLDTMFHATSQRINNKLVIGGAKTEVVDGILIPFHYFSIIFTPDTLSNQRLYRMNANNLYSDSSFACSALGTMQDDGDAGCEFFEVYESDSLNNFIQITRELDNFSEISGIFSVSLRKIQNCSSAFYPDKVLIRKGYFHYYLK